MSQVYVQKSDEDSDVDRGGSLRPEFLRRRLFCRICVYVRLLWGARRKPDAEMGYGTHLSLRLRPRLWMLLVLIISLITSTYCA